MLVWCIETLNSRRIACTTYDELVEIVFGWYGGVGMRVMTIAELYGGVVCMVVLHMVNWPVLLDLPPMLLPGVETKLVVTAAVCILALPTMLVQTRHLAMFAAVGLTATFTVAIVTVIAPIAAGLPLPDGAACDALDASTQPTDTMGHAMLRLEGIGMATGLSLFAFAGHATFPELWRQMAASERAKFGAACDVGFGLAAVFYCTLAAIGYFFFGECAADSLTLNLMAASPSLGGVATAGVLLSTFTSISVLSVPPARICREALAADKAAINALRRREAAAVGLFQPCDAISLAIKAFMMGLAGVLATTVPNFGVLVAFIGAFTCMLISFILPTLCNIAVHRKQLSPLMLTLNGLIVLIGFVGMFVGVQSTLGL